MEAETWIVEPGTWNVDPRNVSIKKQAALNSVISVLSSTVHCDGEQLDSLERQKKRDMERGTWSMKRGFVVF